MNLMTYNISIQYNTQKDLQGRITYFIKRKLSLNRKPYLVQIINVHLCLLVK